jgi:AcrR family transcriptional regulator
MTDKKRQYRKKRRAELEAKTRAKIAKSTADLHGTLGPSRTTISAIAKHAGVRRSTVYRHFPDEAALFDACNAHWRALHPPPNISGWAAIAEPDKRLAVGLREMYVFYHGTGRMYDNLFRDERIMAVVKETFKPFRNYISAAYDVLMQGRPRRKREPVTAAIGHAIAFQTWRSLVREQGLDDGQAAALMCRMVAAAGE